MSDNANRSGQPPELMRVLIADDVMETRRSTRLMMTLVPEARVVAVAENGRQAYPRIGSTRARGCDCPTAISRKAWATHLLLATQAHAS